MSDAPEKLSDRDVKWRDRTLLLAHKLHTEYHVPWTEIAKYLHVTPQFLSLMMKEKFNYEDTQSINYTLKRT
jgi:hypothetical protein